jgi:hypothetical protein
MRVLASVFVFFLVLGCDSSPTPPAMDLSAERFANSEWSAPVHLDAPINSPFRELGAALSPDELSLYFGSNRPDPTAQGAFDIWVSHRACLECPWGDPVNLGPNINSPGGDGSPMLSHDGLLLFFSGSRAGGQGGEDIWVARRTDPNDDLSWGPPVNLGPDVNTPANEGGPDYVPALAAEGANLYFDRQGTTVAGADIYQVSVTRDGEPLGPATPVAELNSSVEDLAPKVRADGKEVYFWSARPEGSVGQSDIWVATRQNPHGEWSTPQNVGPGINTPFADLTPSLSWDGRTLLFSAAPAARPSLGLQDIWMSTRTPSGH